MSVGTMSQWEVKLTNFFYASPTEASLIGKTLLTIHFRNISE